MGEAAYLYNRMLEPFFVGDMPVEGAFCGLRSMELADRLELSPALVRSYAFMALTASLTPLKGVARRWVEHALASAEKLGDERTLLYCLARLAGYSTSVCSWEENDRWLSRAEEIARRLGDGRRLEECLIISSYGLELRGRLSEVASRTREQLTAALRRGDGQTTFFARAALTPVLAQLGHGDEALSILEEGRAWVAEKAIHGERTWFQCSLTRCHRAQGNLARAVESARAALELMRERRPVLFTQGIGTAAVAETLQMAWEQAQPAQVRDLARVAKQARAILDVYAMSYASIQPMALIIQGTEAWLEGKHARALSRLRRALAEARRLGLTFSEAKAHFELGRRLSSPERRVQLERAVALFGEMGARYEEGLAREELSRAE
jgi:tetratricopeptide (TPR) repeat protein